MKKKCLKYIKVFVVIPCFNEKNNIEELIEAVMESPVPNKEIIIVDDCSDDGIQEILEKKIENC